MTGTGPKGSDVDVCVVGAGPAGLALALMLLRSGLTVAVVERSEGLDRQFRGDILQPGGQRVLDQLGVLAQVRARGAYEHTTFRLVQGEAVLVSADYRQLEGPHDHLLSVPQPHVLAELLARCQEHAGFRFLGGRRVSALHREAGRVTGVRATGRSGAVDVSARCVVGADGRFSKVRRLAGITAPRLEVFDQDVLWFTIPGTAADRPTAVTVRRSGGLQLLTYASVPDRIQIGMLLPHGGYRDLVAGGIDRVRDDLAAALPEWADRIRATVTGFDRLTLLDVFGAVADHWSEDGLVLLGDSAHTHSPIGAQGINLALQDAAVLHPILVRALARDDVGAAALSVFEQVRRPVAERVLRTQAGQSRAMLSSNPMVLRVRPVVARIVARTPIFRRILTRIAYCGAPVDVRTDLFVESSQFVESSTIDRGEPAVIGREQSCA